MSAEKEQKSQAAAWTITLVLVPVLYLLSYGPARYLNMKLTPSSAVDAFMDVFGAPYNWLHANTPFEKQLEDYVIWWQAQAFKP